MSHVYVSSVPDLEISKVDLNGVDHHGQRIYRLTIASGVHLTLCADESTRTIVRKLIDQLQDIERRIAAELDQVVMDRVAAESGNEAPIGISTNEKE